MSTETDLALKAATLARSAPQAWKEFLQALGAHANTVVANCVAAPVDILPVAQGRAQNALAVHKALSTALETADKIERKQQG